MKARRIRKALGGGMRQAGIIASAGLVALENNKNQIAEDHLNATYLAEGIDSIKGLTIDTSKVKTNILYCKLDLNIMNSNIFLQKCEENGILFFEYFKGEYRLVTHYGVTKKDIEFTISTMNKILS